jgi:hypothetical protein
MLGLTRDRFTKSQLRQRINQALSNEYSYDSISFHSITLSVCVKRYSEQITSDPEKDLQKLFDITAGRDIDTSFSDLKYFSNKQYEYNKSIEGAIGEGLGGYLIQREGYDPIARPLNTIPDILMQKNHTIAFVEAKATVEGNIHTPMRKAAIDIMELLAKSPYLLTRPFIGYVVGIEIKKRDRFIGHILELRPT